LKEIEHSMKKAVSFLALIIVAVLFFDSCTNNNKQDLLKSSVCDTTNIKYATTVAPLMTAYCTNCHGGGSPSAGINLEGYSNVKQYVNNESLWGSMNHSNGFKPMPQGAPKLDPCTLNKLLAWIQAGALNN